MKQNKFTIIVPTRERADTLYWCLKTLVAQDYENLEILVSDNFSQDNTKEVVDSFNDKRIRYINTGKRVEMSLNWEFGLNHVTDLDSYVGILGDDDGYLPGTITALNILINNNETDGVVWKAGSYEWLNTQKPDFEPSLQIPVTTNILENRDCSEWYHKATKLNISMTNIICIYTCGVVSVKIIQKIRDYYGCFFRSSMPDLFSSFILTKFAKNYLYIDKVLSIGGTSKKANSYLEPQVIALFYKEQTLSLIHKLLGNEIIYSWIIFNADAVLYAEEDNKSQIHSKTVNNIINTVLENIMNEIKYYPLERYLHTIQQVDKLLSLYPNKEKKWQKIILQNPNLYKVSNLRSSQGIKDGFIKVSVNDLQVENIYQACNLCYILLHGTKQSINVLENIQVIGQPRFLYSILKKTDYIIKRILAKYLQKSPNFNIK